MNLVLSGRVHNALRSDVAAQAEPRRAITISPNACRLEDITHSLDRRKRIKQLCEAAEVDHAFVEPESRFQRFKLLALDMDSTLINIECVDEIAFYIGKREEVAAITAATMNGEISDFSESLRRRVRLLRGARVDVLRRVFDERLHLTLGANALLESAREAGIYILLLSGGFTYFTNRLKNALNIDKAVANTLEISNGVLTGSLREPILDAAGKLRHLEQTMALIECDKNDALVIGDGANDIPMLQAVTHSIAFHAKPAVNDIARFAIKFGGLDTTLNFFQQ